jgi:hypothetical protein
MEDIIHSTFVKGKYSSLKIKVKWIETRALFQEVLLKHCSCEVLKIASFI